MSEKTDQLKNESIGKLLNRFFWPAFVGVIANALYNIVDRIFIGRFIGADALSGVTATFPVMLVLIAFGMLIGVGSGVVLSVKLGENNREEGEKVLGNNIVLTLFMSVFLFVITEILKVPMMNMFGASDKTLSYALDYLGIIQFGFIFSILGFSLNNLIRSEGNARIAMYSMIISSVSNIFLDWLFLAQLGMGVKGAAYATVISMLILTIWVILHFKSKRSVIKLHRRNLRVNWALTAKVIGVGMAPFSMQIASSLVQGLYNKQLIAYGGDLAVGVMGILLSITSLIIMMIFALNMAAQPIIGYNYGAKSFKRVKETLSISIKSATVLSISSLVAVLLFTEKIIQLFVKNEPEIIEMGKIGLPIFIAALPIIGFQIIGGNYFQSVGKAKISVFLTLLRQVIILAPLIIIVPMQFGLMGIWLSQPISDCISAFVSFYFIRREWKRLSKKST